MIGTESFFSYRQGASVQPLRIGIATLVAVERRRIVQGNRDIGMVGAKGFFADRQSALVQRFRLRIASLLSV